MIILPLRERSTRLESGSTAWSNPRSPLGSWQQGDTRWFLLEVVFIGTVVLSFHWNLPIRESWLSGWVRVGERNIEVNNWPSLDSTLYSTLDSTSLDSSLYSTKTKYAVTITNMQFNTNTETKFSLCYSRKQMVLFYFFQKFPKGRGKKKTVKKRSGWPLWGGRGGHPPSAWPLLFVKLLTHFCPL